MSCVTMQADLYVFWCLESIISWFKILNFKPQAIVFGSTDTFVSDLIGIPEYRLSCDVVQMIVNERRHEKINILHMRKQRRRSAAQ